MLRQVLVSNFILPLLVNIVAYLIIKKWIDKK